MSRKLRKTAEEPILLYDFLRLELGLTKKQIRQLKFREPGITVNGRKENVTVRLSPGDVVEADAEAKAEPKLLALNPSPIEILYEDEDLIALNKPAGLSCHPGGVHQTDTLANMLLYYFHEKGEPLVARPAGRLDKETSGVILFSKNQAAAARMAKERERKLLKKEYLALAAGRFEEREGQIDLPLRRDPANACRVITAPEGKPALTRYQVLWEGETFSLLRVRIETGRMHQIRVHMAESGHPLLGDVLYGGSVREIGRAALHAERLTCLQPFTSENLSITAPLPADMARLIPAGQSANLRQEEPSIVIPF